jgi:hypothetical protein
MSKQIATVYHWRKVVAALVLAAALTSLPVLAANVPGPLSSIFVETVYAGCPVGGSCG